MRTFGKVLLTGGIIGIAVGRMIQMRKMPFRTKKMFRMGRRFVMEAMDVMRFMVPRIRLR